MVNRHSVETQDTCMQILIFHHQCSYNDHQLSQHNHKHQQHQLPPNRLKVTRSLSFLICIQTTRCIVLGCGFCCPASYQCHDQIGYCVCSCLGSKCTECQANAIVHPLNGKCSNIAKTFYPFLPIYKLYLNQYGLIE